MALARSWVLGIGGALTDGREAAHFRLRKAPAANPVTAPATGLGMVGPVDPSLPLPSAPVRLVQLTDFHLFADPHRGYRHVQPLQTLAAAVQAAATDIADADVLLATGDLVQDEPAAYAHIHRILGGLGKPVCVIPGNHDDAPLLAQAFAAPPFQVGGQVDLGAWRIVLLDSSVPGRAEGHLTDAELRRLDAALAAAGPRHALVVLHHPPIPLGSAWLDDIGLADAETLLAVVDRHPAVRGILFGHVHQVFDGQRGAVRILGTPSTCAQFKPGVADFAMDVLPPAWRQLSLHADGRIETRVGWVATED